MRAAMIAIAATVIAILVVVATGGGSSGRLLRVEVPDATNVIAGQRVRAGGRPVGEVTGVRIARGGRAALVSLRLDDPGLAREGVRLQLRWGGTVAFSNRYFALHPAPEGARELPDGARLPASAVSVPVEFDELLSAFTPRVRRDLRDALTATGKAMGLAERPLRDTLSSAPPAVRQLSGLLSDLNSQSADLDTLMRSADDVTGAVRRADPGIGRLVAASAATFSAAASHARDIRTALAAAPRAVRTTRSSLRQADATLRLAGALTGRLAPGVRDLRRLTGPLARLLARADGVLPGARATLAGARRASPPTDAVLRKLGVLAPRIASIGRRSTRQLACIRPYTPDIVSFFSVWAGDRVDNSDGTDRYGRVAIQAPPFNNAQVGDSAQVAEQNPGLTYAYPAPPGLAAGQPWLQPDCGIGREVFDPAKDPESRRGR